MTAAREVLRCAEHAVSALRVQAGGGVLVSVPRDTTAQEAAMIRERVQQAWPDVTCVVTTGEVRPSPEPIDPEAVETAAAWLRRSLRWRGISVSQEMAVELVASLSRTGWRPC